jgi:hypothetical protein
MTKQALLYYVHRNILMAPFLYIIYIYFIFQIILDKIVYIYIYI